MARVSFAALRHLAALLCLGATQAVSGCGADYLNNYDSVTLAAGDANQTNSLLQTVDPLNPNSQKTHIEGDGQRIAAIVQRYRGGGPSATTVQQRGADQDCAGGPGNNPVAHQQMVTGGDLNHLDGNHNGIGCEGK
ncbi:calcium-binding protein [Mesorhizobium sp.]|uniref:calcium-binding protein n=1 Tax=Mesorhizobium sp. TaxID=1871066 RepID=UPI0025C386F3|nr:calcium-binding protein [Mesorhizobium sp.]